ncbi:MAG: hypothetical protein QNJ98_04780 [Planctomycetota bacterium]|nr:hypothetical protein [Planctomycetota bacterium]
MHEEFGHAGQRYHRKDNSNALLIGSIAALAVAAILIFVLMGQDDETPEDPAKKGPKTTAQNPAGTGTGTMPIQPTPLDPSGAMPGAPGKLPGGPGVVPGTPGANPGATAPDNPNPTPKKRRTRPRVSQIELKKFDWPDEVDAATRAAAEEHLENMVEIGGRDGRDAEDWFRAQGRKICGRLISEFPVIIERYGMERQGMMRLMVIDRVLSTIDGTLEREWKSRQRIHHVSDPKIAMARLKRWTYWWESGLWKDTPVKPWDPREDEVDPEAAKKDDAGRGFGKRAGK